MDFDFDSLEPHIRQILAESDLGRVSAKDVRKQLPALNIPSITESFIKEHKEAINHVISRIYLSVTQEKQPGESDETDTKQNGSGSGKSNMKQSKTKKKSQELSDAEIARQLSNELNARSSSRRTARPTNSPRKKTSRVKKSAAQVDSDSDPDNAREQPEKKVRRRGKTGFDKEFLLSASLASVCSQPDQTGRLSRPQVVKRLWEYIKGNDLQNPDNRREILCDPNLKAVFGKDKVGIFAMNKLLGDHLYEVE